MPDSVSITAYLRHLHAVGVVSVGPREHLAVERLLRARKHWPEDELRAALASLLSGNREEWRAVAAEFDATFLTAKSLRSEGAQRPPDRIRRRDGAGQPIVELEPVRAPSRWERYQARLRAAGGRLREAALNARRGWWMAAIVLLISVIVVVALVPVAPKKPPVDSKDGTEPPELEIVDPETGTYLKRLHQRKDLTIEIPVTPERELFEKLAFIALIGFVLTGLGIRFMGLPRAAAARRTSRATQRKAETRAKRSKLEEAQAASREALQIRYHVPERAALSRQGILDSAELLGRLLREERGDEVAPLPTLRRTLAAGGRFTPVMKPRHVRQEVLLLVDVEQGDHPWLPGFLRVVEAWRRQGVPLLRFDFQMVPVSLVDPDSRETWGIDEVARRTEGLPLIIFSRQLRPAGRTGEARWLGSLPAWPVRAWLDPDPRPLGEHTPMRRREIAELKRRRFGRFPLTDRGVVAMARWLAADGESPLAVDWGALAPRWGAPGEPLEEALRKWALAAALVPDPSWDQLEAIRLHFPEVHGVLPARRDLQRLLDWVGEQTHAPVELQGGRCLYIPEEHQDFWLRRQRDLARQSPAQRDFEERVRRLLLAQLEPARPSDSQELELQRWRLKVAMHTAVIKPGKAQERLGWAFHSAVAHEASRWVQQELARQEKGLSGACFSRSDVEYFEGFEGTGEGVSIREFVLGHPRLWVRALLALAPALLVVLAYDSARPLLERLAAWGEDRTVEIEARLPAVFALETAGNWVELAGGSFLMGSEDGDPDERPVRRVTVQPFELTRTEVTVAEYGRCVEAQVCKEPRSGGDCNWGVEGRDRHPMNCVSWEEARIYAQWAGARLPTEAEWEYAARGEGEARKYPWGDQPADCTRAVVSDGGDGCGRDSTWPVSSKPAGNTPQGLCDMAGNVWEWVEDDYHSNYIGAPTDGSAWVDTPRGSGRVFRGGSWWDNPRDARVAIRYGITPGRRFGNVGFRLARSLPSGI